MKISHTKGEWRFETSSRGANNYQFSTKDQIIGILETSPEVDSVKEGLANAKLIAAAPDLLESLEYILDAIEEGKVYIEEIEMSDDLSPEEWQLKAIEAIQKATS